MQSQKRPSPPSSSVGPAAKKLKNEDGLYQDEQTPTSFPGSGTASVHGTRAIPSDAGPTTAAAPQMVDPDQLSDALLSAGVDLKEEESLLSSTLPTDPYGKPEMYRFQSYGASGPAPLMQSSFLDSRNLQSQVRKTSTEMGIKYVFDRDNEIMSLLSISCQEWLRDIITSTVELSRHRRRSRNDVHSKVAKALRTIAIKDKEIEDKRFAAKAALGLDQTSETEKKEINEESEHRAANATALMMTQGKKKYSWLTGGSGPGTTMRPGLGRSENAIRLREAREEPGLALRDLLAALEDRRFGTDKALMKGYAKLRN